MNPPNNLYEIKPPSMRRQAIVLIFSIIALFMIVAVSIAMGSVYVPLDRVIQILLYNSGDYWENMIILNARLPRVLGAVLGGAAISCAGLLLQVYFRNPIVDPYVLGVSSGASLIVAMGLLFGVYLLPSVIAYPALLFGSFIGAILVTLAIIMVASVVRSSTTLLLIGLMIGYLLRAFIDIMITRAETIRVHAFTLWMYGTFANVTWGHLNAMIAVIPLIIFACLFSKPLNAMLLGEEYAKSVGVNVKKVRIVIITLSALLTAIIVTFAGPIAFIGMAVPHIGRLTLKTSNNRYLVPTTAILGAIVAVLCDLVARCAFTPVELPLSAVTSIFGAPMIIILLLRMRSYVRA
ncbi:MAG: iron ABC transporter permease [Candidatus Bathyarchaeia archaeon]